MTARAYRDLGARLKHLPGRVWCALFHRSQWKPWWTIHRRDSGEVWIGYYCRRDGQEYICPKRGHGEEGAR